jgi:hypothetical protein
MRLSCDVLIARRRAAARKMKQLKNASKETDDVDNEEDIDDYGELSGICLDRYRLHKPHRVIQCV